VEGAIGPAGELADPREELLAAEGLVRYDQIAVHGATSTGDAGAIVRPG
jgi:hypothetical protein